jgi:hypothetical protein
VNFVTGSKLVTKKISVDFESLFDAFDTSSECFINLKTGEVITVPDEADWFDDEIKRLKADGRTFARLDPFPSNVAFGVMQEFVEKLEKKHPAKASLVKALSGPKPFRKFKDAIDNFSEVRTQWFAFKRKEMEYWVPWWVRKNSIGVEVVIKNDLDITEKSQPTFEN